jgi:hypothetical protein
VILSSIAVFAMFGVLFTMPQYFQGVLGTDAMGSGLRLVPLVGALVVGAAPADQIAHMVGVKATVALGFATLAAGLLLGADTSVGSSGFFVAAWMALVGAGMGLALATATSAALSELSEERSGVGSAALQALNKMGGPLGTGDPRQRAQLRLPGSPRPVRPAGHRGDGRQAEHLWRGGSRAPDQLAGTARLSSHGIRRRDGPRTAGVRLRRAGRCRAHSGVPARCEGRKGGRAAPCASCAQERGGVAVGWPASDTVNQRPRSRLRVAGHVCGS